MVIIKEVLIEKFLRAVLFENGIVEVVWDTSIVTLEPAHLSKMRQVLFEFGAGKKMPLFFTAHDFLEVSAEGRKDAASEEGVKYTLANAVLIDSPAKRIAMNFFMNFNKPNAPTKGFSTREEAFVWLENLKEEAE